MSSPGMRCYDDGHQLTILQPTAVITRLRSGSWPLDHWDRGFDSHWRHGRVFVQQCRKDSSSHHKGSSHFCNKLFSNNDLRTLLKLIVFQQLPRWQCNSDRPEDTNNTFGMSAYSKEYSLSCVMLSCASWESATSHFPDHAVLPTVWTDS